MRMAKILIATVLLFVVGCAGLSKYGEEPEVTQSFKLHSIGTVKKQEGHTYIVIDKQYEPGLMHLDDFSHVTVIYWFDKNDTPEKRAVLQVHPQGNKDNPMRGVFATHSPVRPNLIAISRCKILSVKDNIIEIDSIDAFPDTPVLDLKN
jgi:tRNA-Thr(GGU) m(6)t(6)A37 methyltransferase TsaA